MLIILFILVFNLSAFEAEEYYYGLGVEQDFTRARELYEKDKDSHSVKFLIMIYLNGDGVKQDYGKADSLWNEFQASGAFIDGALGVLKGLIDERVKNPDKIFPRVTYRDFAYTTIEIGHCLSIERELQIKRECEVKDLIVSGLDRRSRELFDTIEELQKDILRYDSNRIMYEYLDGSISGIASIGMEEYLDKRHHRRVERFIGNRESLDKQLSDYNISDNRLNEVYRNRRVETKATYDGLIDIYIGDGDKERADEYKKVKESILSDLKSAQLVWIKYRNCWVKLIKYLNPEGDLVKLENNLLSILTEERTTELMYDPIVGE